MADSAPDGDGGRAAFAAMSEVALALAAERTVEPVLQRLVHSARDLVAARYAALGIPDEQGGFARFLTSGISEAQRRAIGPLPRTHGLLGAMLTDTASYRTTDIRTDPRFWGWPSAHPDMRSFLGVPIVAKGEVVGALYLTDKRGAAAFTDADQSLIELLAAHAAIAIDNARLWERSRELTVREERTRIARDLHDAMTQTLFSLNLTAEAAATALDTDPAAARDHIRTVRRLASETLAELRALIFELRPADLDAEGLVPTLRKHVDVLRRAHRVELDLRVTGERRLAPAVERELFRVAQEAVHNALRHGAAARVTLELDLSGDRARLVVRDDGAGFDAADPQLQHAGLGLTSMRERAAALGGRLDVTSRPGAGTTVTLDAPALSLVEADYG